MRSHSDRAEVASARMNRKSFDNDRNRASAHLRWWLLAAAALATLAIHADPVKVPSLSAPADESWLEPESMFEWSLDSELTESTPFVRAQKAAAAENWEGVLAALAEQNARGCVMGEDRSKGIL